jgi:hypothetical protein
MSKTSRYVSTHVEAALSMFAGGVLAPESTLPIREPHSRPDRPTTLRFLGFDAAVAALPPVLGDSVPESPCLMEVSSKSLATIFPDGVPATFAGVLPIEVVDSVVVGSETARSGIGALPVSNIAVDDLNLRIADLDRSTILGLDSASESIDDGAALARAEAVDSSNRLAGGLSLLVSAGPIAESSARLAEAIHQVWLKGPDGDSMSRAMASVCEGPSDAESAVISAVLALLDDEEPGSVLDASRIASELLERAPHPDALESLEYIRDVVRSERPLVRFPDRPGLTSARSLLLFLLRPDPGEIVSWFEDDHNAGAAALGVATVLSGYRAGYRGLALGERGTEKLRDWMQRQIANTINTVIGAAANPLRKDHPLKAKYESTELGDVVRFSSYRLKLAERTAERPPSIRRRLLNGEDLPGVLESVAEELGWVDLAITVVQTAAEFEVNLSDDGFVVTFRGPARVNERFDRERALSRIEDLGDSEVSAAVARSGSDPQARASVDS